MEFFLFEHHLCSADVHSFHPLHKNNIFKSFTAIISDVSEFCTVFTYFMHCVATLLSPSPVQLSCLTVHRILNAFSPLCSGKKERIKIFYLMLSIFNTSFYAMVSSGTGKNGTRCINMRRICG